MGYIKESFLPGSLTIKAKSSIQRNTIVQLLFMNYSLIIQLFCQDQEVINVYLDSWGFSTLQHAPPNVDQCSPIKVNPLQKRKSCQNEALHSHPANIMSILMHELGKTIVDGVCQHRICYFFHHPTSQNIILYFKCFLGSHVVECSVESFMPKEFRS